MDDPQAGSGAKVSIVKGRKPSAMRNSIFPRMPSTT